MNKSTQLPVEIDDMIELSRGFGGRHWLGRYLIEKLGEADQVVIDPLAGIHEAGFAIAAAGHQCDVIAVESDRTAIKEAKIMADKLLGTGV